MAVRPQSVIAPHGAVAGTLSTKADGTFTGNTDGPVSGRYTLGTNGQVLVTLNGQSGTNLLLLNAGKDLMVLAHRENDSEDNFQEIMLFVRAPASVTKADLAGFWNGKVFRTPALVSWSPSSGLQGGDNFEIGESSLTVKSDGTLTGNDPDGTFSGSFSIAGGGKVGVSGSSSQGSFKATLFVNADKDLLVLVSGSTDPNDNEQEIRIFQRAPVFSVP